MTDEPFERTGRRDELTAAVPRPPGSPGRRPGLAALLALLGVAIGANAVYPVLVVSPRTAGALVYAVTTGLLAVMALLAVSQCRPAMRLLTWFVVLVLVAALTLVGAVVLLFRHMDVVARHDVPGWGERVTYTVDGGATTGYARWVRHERQMLPGVLIVTSTHVDRCSPADETCG